MADECVICHEPKSDATQVHTLDCAHSFHVGCINTWLSTAHATCPLCVQPVDETQLARVAVDAVAAAESAAPPPPQQATHLLDMSACAVSGVARSRLVEVRCMGTPMMVPRDIVVACVPLIKRLIESPFNTSPTEACVVEIDAPVTMFARIYEALCVTGDASSLSPGDCAFFQISYDVEPERPKPPPPPPSSVVAPLETRNTGTGSISYIHVQEEAAGDSSFFRNLPTTTLRRIVDTPDEDGGLALLRETYTHVDASLPNNSFTLQATTGAQMGRVTFEVPRFCDVIASIDLVFHLAPDETRLEPLPLDFVDCMLVERLTLEIGSINVCVKTGRTLIADLLARRTIEPRRDLAADYCDMTDEERLSVTRRGFVITLRDVFGEIDPKSFPHVAIFAHRVSILVDRPSVADPYGIQLVHAAGYTHYLKTEYRNAIAANKQIFLAHAYYSERVVNNRVDFNGSTPIAGVIVTLPWRTDRDYVYEHPFIDATLRINGSAVITHTAETMRHSTWLDGGFAASPVGLRRHAYYFPFSKRFDGGDPTMAFSAWRAHEACIVFRRVDTNSADADIEATVLSYNMDLVAGGMFVRKFAS